MEQLPLAWNGDTEFGIVQWESQGHALTVTVQCPLLTDDIYRAYWHDKNGQECLLFVLEPIKNQLFGKKNMVCKSFFLATEICLYPG